MEKQKEAGKSLSVAQKVINQLVKGDLGDTKVQGKLVKGHGTAESRYSTNSTGEGLAIQDMTRGQFRGFLRKRLMQLLRQGFDAAYLAGAKADFIEHRNEQIAATN